MGCRNALGVAMLAALLAASSALLIGCPPPGQGGAQAIEPRDDINAMSIAVSPPNATDTDGDNLPDAILVVCNLWVDTSDGTLPAVGKGKFRFELLDPKTPPDDRQPFMRVLVNQEQADACLFRGSYGMPAYAFRVPLGKIPPSLTEVILRARFIPDGAPEIVAEPRTVPVPSYGRP